MGKRIQSKAPAFAGSPSFGGRLTPSRNAAESIQVKLGMEPSCKHKAEGLIVKYQTRRWDVARTGAQAAVPAKKTATAKRAAHTTR